MRSKERRKFFHKFLTETISFIEEINGRPQMRLSELKETPDEIIRTIVPKPNQHHHYYIEDGYVYKKKPELNMAEKIYELDPTEKYIIPLFDGKRSIEKISMYISNLLKLDYNESYKKVKNLFLFLTKFNLFHPLHAHERLKKE